MPEPPVSAETVVARAARALAEPVLGDVVVLDPATDRYVRLNETAAVLWEAIAEPTPVAQLARVVSERFEVADERALADAAAFVRELAARDLVVLDGA